MNKHKQYYYPCYIHHLTDVLVDDIFFRLALTSLFRCKSVCKRWASLISSREFQEDYIFHRIMSLQKRCTLVGREMYNVVEGDKKLNTERNNNLDLITNICNELECSNFSVLAFPRNKSKRSKGFVLDSSNGLLLCSVSNYCYYRPLEFYVCSPIIQQWIKIPNPTNRNIYSKCLGVGFTTQLQGLTTVTNYKVIIVLGQPFRFEIFSSETATWETHYVNLNPNIRLWITQHVAVVNKLGILHWIINDFDGVLAYDPNSNRDWCSVINLPRNNNNNQVVGNVHMPSYKDINAFEESFRYMEMLRTPGQGFHLYIWTLENYDNSGTWHLDHKIRLYDFRFYCADFFCYKIGQFDSNILYIWIYTSNPTKELLTYDFRTQKFNDLTVGWERNWLQLDHRSNLYDQGALPLKLPVWPTTIKLQGSDDVEKPAADVEKYVLWP